MDELDRVFQQADKERQVKHPSPWQLSMCSYVTRPINVIVLIRIVNKWAGR